MLNVAFLNFYMSALRNMFLTSSIAIGMAGFSDRFGKTNKLILRAIALCIMLLSIGFGYRATVDFGHMLASAASQENLNEHELTIVQQAHQWPLFAYAYMATVGTVIFTFAIKQLKE